MTEQEAKMVVIAELGKMTREFPQGITLDVTPRMVKMVCCASDLIREIPLTPQTTREALAKEAHSSLVAMHKLGPSFMRSKMSGKPGGMPN
jgi:hypothetical protein